MFGKFLKFGTKKGESLVEVIMAVFVVSMGSAVATSLIVSALQSNEFTRDNLIALNLAVEGMEAIRGVRDANWLKFSYDKEGCWKMRPEIDVCTPGVNEIEAGNYTVDLSVKPNEYSWSIPKPPIALALDLDNGFDNSPYQLVYYDLDITKNSDGDPDPANDRDVLGTKGFTPLQGAQTGTSPYYRMVKIQYTSPEEMDVTSTVQWRTQGLKHQIELTSKLTNYQKVKIK